MNIEKLKPWLSKAEFKEFVIGYVENQYRYWDCTSEDRFDRLEPIIKGINVEFLVCNYHLFEYRLINLLG